jgi:HlyD family secretion protein
VSLRTFSACLLVLASTLLGGCAAQPAAATLALDRGAPRPILVSAPGLVEPASEAFTISSELNGRVRDVLVEEGDHVQRGQVVATLEDAEYQAKLQSAEAEVEQRKSELNRLIAGARAEERQIAKIKLEEAEAVLQNSRMELQRRQELYRSGDVSREELERADRDYKVAAARNEQALQNHALVNAEPRVDDVAKAEAAVSVATGLVLESRARLAKTVIRSPIDGTVLRKQVKRGESVLSGAIVTVGDTAGLRVRIDVDESDIGMLQVGQRAYVSAQAYGDEKFWGRVVRISQILGKKNIRTNEPAERVDTKILETLVEMDEDCKLPPGLRVNGFIIVKE